MDRRYFILIGDKFYQLMKHDPGGYQIKNQVDRILLRLSDIRGLTWWKTKGVIVREEEI